MQHVYMSCKYRENDSKQSIESYDVDKIICATHQTSNIYVCCNNASAVKNVFRKANQSNNHLKQAVSGILGVSEFESSYSKLRRLVLTNKVAQRCKELTGPLKPLDLYFHQCLFVERTIEAFNNGTNKVL